MTKEITAAEWQEKVINQKGFVVVDFYSTECPPCEALAPKFEYFEENYKNQAHFYKIFRQGNRELATDLAVKGSPTLLFFKDGKEVAPRLSGAIKKSEIKRTFVEILGFEDLSKNIERTHEHYDLVVIGAGPAGLTAGLYAGRAKIKTLLIDQGNPGGYVNLTHLVANYPGTEDEINGYMLMHKMTEQAKKNKAKILQSAEIVNMDLKKKEIYVDDDKAITADAFIFATGSKPRSLNLPGEKEFFGKGISYCATCDGAFYKDKEIIVIGGGNSAVEEAIYLTKFASKITIVHQFDEFQANKTASDELIANDKVEVLWSHEPRAFLGEDQFETLEVEDLKTGEHKKIKASGVFVFIGYVPQTDLFAKEIELDKWGCVVAKEQSMETNVPGVFVAGDVRSKLFRQITTAVADGTIAALSAQKYLKENKLI